MMRPPSGIKGHAYRVIRTAAFEHHVEGLAPFSMGDSTDVGRLRHSGAVHQHIHAAPTVS